MTLASLCLALLCTALTHKSSSFVRACALAYARAFAGDTVTEEELQGVWRRRQQWRSA